MRPTAARDAGAASVGLPDAASTTVTHAPFYAATITLPRICWGWIEHW